MFHPDGPSLRDLTVQALSSTRRGYDLLAPKFDLTPFRTPRDLLSRVTSQLSADAPYAHGVDLCCGTGAGVHALRELCDEVTGVDYSEGMLAEAERRLVHAPGAAPVRWVRADVFDLPFDDDSFDLATSFGAFGHIVRPRQPAFLAEVRRVLRPGGRFVFVTQRLPPLWSRKRILYTGFNAVMRARNRVLDPPFIMYYLNFTVPEILPKFEHAGFDMDVRPLGLQRWPQALLVSATRR